MSSPTGQRLSLRRSSRQSVPTVRAEQYMVDASTSDIFSPKEGDDIYVRWIFRGREVWWPASALEVENGGVNEQFRLGRLQYHKFGMYQSEKARVVFNFDRATGARVVATITDNATQFDHRMFQQNQSSWISKAERHLILSESSKNYSSHAQSTVHGTVPKEESAVRSISTNHQGSWRRSQKPPISKQRSRFSKGPTPNRRGPLSSKSNEPHRYRRSSFNEDRLTADDHEDTFEDPLNINDSVTMNSELSSLKSKLMENEIPKELQNESPTDINAQNLKVRETRLSLIEQKLVNSVTSPAGMLSAPTHSVISSLRWAFLKSLDRPVKEVHPPHLDQYVIASKTIEVKVSCDYMTFKEIAAYLSLSNCNNDNHSRLVFSPAFHITQAGSTAVNNMSILFSTLFDVLSVLRIKNDHDYESILCTEATKKHTNVFRYLGTYIIHEGNGLGVTSKREDVNPLNSSDCISVSSRASKKIRLFLGSSPVKYIEVPNVKCYKKEEVNVENLSDYPSVILQQKCVNFCPVHKCFQSTWTGGSVGSNFRVNCEFDDDGTVPPSELSKFFVLRWNRLEPPSTASAKWTKDVIDVGSNTPGTLTLAVPSVYMCASRNVESLIKLMDTHIESFMNLRSLIHPTN